MQENLHAFCVEKTSSGNDKKCAWIKSFRIEYNAIYFLILHIIITSSWSLISACLLNCHLFSSEVSKRFFYDLSRIWLILVKWWFKKNIRRRRTQTTFRRRVYWEGFKILFILCCWLNVLCSHFQTVRRASLWEAQVLIKGRAR